MKEQAKLIGRAMAEHCDKRIARARDAIDREEKYLLRTLRSRSAGGVMSAAIVGAFHRLHAALDKAR